MEPITISFLIFLLTFLLIITEMVHKTLAALLGAFLMIMYELVEYNDIGSFIDFRAIGVILGIMIVVEVVKESGIFQFIGIKVVRFTKGEGKKLFLGMILLTTLLTSFMSNTTTILIVAALTFTLCRSIKLDPVPFLISEIIIVNIAGMMLLISSTPNIIIAGAANLKFNDFLIYSTPLSIILIFVDSALLMFIFRDQFKNIKKIETENLNEWSVVTNKSFFWRSLVILVGMITLFIFSDKIGLSLDFIALSTAILLLLLSGADPDKVLMNIQWGTLFFFMGLFIVVGGLEKSGFLEMIGEKMIEMIGENKILSLPLVVWSSGITSGIVDNIPMAVTFIPIVRNLVSTFQMTIIWWGLIFGVIIGGNLTPIGSPASVVAMGIAKKEGYSISFERFFKIGFMTTIVNLIITTIYLVGIFLIF
ncbi:MAG: SLC13 family permease [Candidatus Aenigmatarchaeota archaeon]